MRQHRTRLIWSCNVTNSPFGAVTLQGCFNFFLGFITRVIRFVSGWTALWFLTIPGLFSWLNLCRAICILLVIAFANVLSFSVRIHDIILDIPWLILNFYFFSSGLPYFASIPISLLQSFFKADDADWNFINNFRRWMNDYQISFKTFQEKRNNLHPRKTIPI